MARGQTSIELMLLLAVSLVALAIIYSLYSMQVDSTNSAKEFSSANGTIRRMVDSANSLYISGAGSSARVFVDIPVSLQMDASGIYGSTLLLTLSNGKVVFGTADVNFSGSWKKLYDDYVMGGYYATLVFDGNKVNIFYDDFELSSESASFFGTGGSTIAGVFNVRNVSNEDATFWVTNSFSHSPYASIVMASGTSTFVLAPQESKRIDFNIVLGSLASGNYSGTIDVIGQISDGFIDSNMAKSVTVSAESYLESGDLEIYPKSTIITSTEGAFVKRTFSICNSSASSISISSWGRDSNKDANMLSWFSWEPKDSLGDPINSISAGACKGFDLNFTIPTLTEGKSYDANFSATYNGIKSSAYLYYSVINPSCLYFNPSSVVTPLGLAGSSSIASFSLCNFCSNDANGINWSRATRADGNMLTWFTWLPKDSLGVDINGVAKNACKDFNLTVTSPSNALSGSYDANFSAIYNGVSSTAYLYDSVWNFRNLFFTTQNDFNSNQNWFSSYFSSATQSNWASPTGELDWNKSANYTFNSADYNRDMNGLVGYWKLNDKNSQGWVLNSATGVRDGNLKGAGDVNGVGLWDTNALWANGTSGYVATTSGVGDSTSKLTVSAWVYSLSGAAASTFVAKDDYGANRSWYFAMNDTTSFKLAIWTSGGRSDFTMSGFQLNKWNHVAFTYDGANVYLYLNGVASAPNAKTGAISTTPTKISIGSITGNFYFTGRIDDVAIWNRTLSVSEIAADYNRFLLAKYSSSVKDLNTSETNFVSLKLNSDANFNFGSELSPGEKFFDANLVGLWHLNDKNSQGWVLNSATGVRDGNLKGAGDVNGVGLWDTNALWANGTSGYVATTSGVGDSTSKLTVSAWVYSLSGASASTFVAKDDMANRSWYFAMNDTASFKLAIWTGAAPGTRTDFLMSGFQLNKWNHVAFTYDGANVYLYLNGVASAPNAKTGAITTTPTKISIGSITGNYYFTGRIEDVAIWNRTLSAAEIADLYRKGISRLDLNVYSCSDAACASIVDTNRFTKVGGGGDLNLSSMRGARYFKYTANFGVASGLSDLSLTPYIAQSYFSYLSDLNFSYIN